MCVGSRENECAHAQDHEPEGVLPCLMTSSPVESATARQAGVVRAPVPRVAAADPTEAVVLHAVARAAAAPRADGIPEQVVAEAAALGGRRTAVAGVTQQPGREGTRPGEGVTAAPGRQELRKNEAAPA